MSLRAFEFACSLAVLSALPASAQSDDGAFVPVEDGKVQARNFRLI